MLIVHNNPSQCLTESKIRKFKNPQKLKVFFYGIFV